MAARPLNEIVEAGWADALAPVADRIAAMGEFLRAEVAAGRTYLPAGENVLRAFKQPFHQVRILIVGQDPYPTPGHPVGLSFSVAPEVRPLPKSLVNIYREYADDLGFPLPANGDLTPWTERGVLLLNRALTVMPGKPNSHQGRGLGRNHRAGHQGASRTRRAAGRDPLGPQRAQPAPAARQVPGDRVRAPEPDVGQRRVLRFPPVQPRQPVARTAGRSADRLETALTLP